VSYTLGFTAGAIQSTASNSIVLTHAAPYRVVVLSQPAGGISGATLPANNYPVLQVRDRFGNPATSDNSTQVTVAVCPQATCAGSSNGGSVTRTTTVTAVGGQVAFDDIAVAGTPGLNYQLRFTSPGLMHATSVAIQLTKVADITLSYPDTNYSPNGLVPAVIATDSPGVVTYSTTSPATVCVLNTSTGTVTIKGVGNCEINAVVAGTTYYLTNNTSATLRILKSAQAAFTLTNATSTNYMQTLTVTSAGGILFVSINNGRATSVSGFYTNGNSAITNSPNVATDGGGSGGISGFILSVASFSV
jgi:streptogramin lyase